MIRQDERDDASNDWPSDYRSIHRYIAEQLDATEHAVCVSDADALQDEWSRENECGFSHGVTERGLCVLALGTLEDNVQYVAALKGVYDDVVMFLHDADVNT